jgi:hypothetical protein
MYQQNRWYKTKTKEAKWKTSLLAHSSLPLSLALLALFRKSLLTKTAPSAFASM